MKRVGFLTIAVTAWFVFLQPSKASAQQYYGGYGAYGNAPYAYGYAQPYNGGYYENGDRRDRRWREHEWREHERHEWRDRDHGRDREYREHEYREHRDGDRHWDRR